MYARSLHRQLSERQLAMIAIGGAIGVGLFLGSTAAINLAGPAIILSYVLSACLALILAYALAEMAVVYPAAGSFGIYAERYLNPWSGFAVRAMYALIQIIAIGAEVTAVGIYFQYWFPGTAEWLWVVLVSFAVVAINAARVKSFGELEYWFSLIKVMAIVVFIVIGIVLIAGLVQPGPAPGLKNLVRYGGFFPHGFKGAWLALTLALPSYMGIEILAVTAGEARQPEKTIPRAMRTIVLRLVLFYVLAMAVMVAMIPWNRTGDGSIHASPFVRAFQAVGIPYAAWIMNLVVVTAAISSANTNLYLSTRMLFSLARRDYAPQALGRLSRQGVPHWALAVSSAGMAAASLLAVYVPKRGFLLMFGSAVAGMYFVWIVILLTHVRFRRELGRDAERLPFKLRLSPLFDVLGILLLIAVAGSTFYVAGLEYSVPIFLVLLGTITFLYWRIRGTLKTRATTRVGPSESSVAEV
ncbi:MAG: amino acid permease [Acidobacteria bacterium]|nr:amino acid permease [Acidobacteriota bacterium]